MLIFLGNHTTSHRIQQKIPRSVEENLRIRPAKAHYCQRSSPTPMVPRNADGRWYRSAQDKVRKGKEASGEAGRGTAISTARARVLSQLCILILFGRRTTLLKDAFPSEPGLGRGLGLYGFLNLLHLRQRYDAWGTGVENAGKALLALQVHVIIGRVHPRPEGAEKSWCPLSKVCRWAHDGLNQDYRANPN